MRRAVSSLILSGLIASAALAAPAPSPALRQAETAQHQREQERDQALSDAEQARREIAQLEAQLAELNKAQQGGERSVSDKRLRLAALNARESELNARLGADQNRLARLLGALELFRRDPPPALLVDPHDIRDAVRAAILIRAITPQLEAHAQALKAEALTIRQARREAATASGDLFTAESSVADRRAKIETLIASKTVLEHRAAADADAANQDIVALSDRARALRGLAQDLAVATPIPGMREPPNPEHAGLFGAAKLFTPPVAGAPIRTFGQAEPSGGRSLGWTWRPGPGGAGRGPGRGDRRLCRAAERLGTGLDLTARRWIPSGACGTGDGFDRPWPDGRGGTTGRPHGGCGRRGAGTLFRASQERRACRSRALAQDTGGASRGGGASALRNCQRVGP